jgi:hypothetical protein
LSDFSQQRKELPFPARLCIRVNSHPQFDAVHPSADLSSPPQRVTKSLAMHSPMQMANIAIFDHIHLFTVENSVPRYFPVFDKSRVRACGPLRC